jgi:hypothetical protein
MAEGEGPTLLVPEVADVSQFYPAPHLFLTPDSIFCYVKLLIRPVLSEVSKQCSTSLFRMRQ